MSNNLDVLAAAISQIIVDYRAEEGKAIAPRDVQEWVNQFSASVREPILQEMHHILQNVYFSKADVERDVATMVRTPPGESDPKGFWRTANFLWIQKKGASQNHLRVIFAQALKAETGLRLEECGTSGGPFVYMDDFVFTANHVHWDLLDWVKSNAAPRSGRIIVLAVVMHSQRTDYAQKQVIKAATSVGKTFTMNDWWHLKAIRQTEYAGSETDVLRPMTLPSGDRHVDQLLAHLVAAGKPFRPRTGLTSASNPVFSSEAARVLLETEFLKAGARIKYDLCPQLPANAWPLGYDIFKGAGFGSLVLNYRNCPNNCPLALWAGDPWKPLFPRRNNPAHQNFDPSVFDLEL